MASTPYKHFVPPVPLNPEYDKNFKYILIESLEQLQSSFRKGQVIAWDTETTGLNPTESKIVGFSYTYDGQTGYYCPVSHFDLALGKDSLDLFYQALRQAKLHLLYNARFDIRIMEYSGYDMSFMYPKDPNTNSSNAQFIDVMNQVWLSDTNIPLPSLKSSTLHFLGYQPPKFLETLGDEQNFQYVPAKQAYIYACLDAINTMNLFRVTFKYYKEAGVVSKLDNDCIYIIGQLEKTPLKINTQYLIDLRDKVYSRVLELEQELYTLAGHPFKIGSNRELTQVFLEQGIDTGERTKAGDMKTGIELLTLYLRNHPDCTILTLLIEYKEQFKFYNSYLKTLVEIAQQQETVPPRFSYKLQSVPCLTENNLVLIKDKGLTYIPDVEEQDLIWTQYGYKRVLWCNSHQSDDIYRIIFSNGTFIEGTSHHPVLVNKGTETNPSLEWATLKSLKKGECVVFNHHTPPLEYTTDQQEEELARYLEYIGFLVSINIEPSVKELEEYNRVLEDFSKKSSAEFKNLTHSIVSDPNVLLSILAKAKPYQWLRFIQGILYPVFETPISQKWNDPKLEQFVIKSEHPILLTFIMNLLHYIGIASSLSYDNTIYSLIFKSSQSLTLFKILLISDTESEYLKSLFQDYNPLNYYLEYADSTVLIVEKVEGEHTVYDIEVEDVHEYVANGIVTHNTGRYACGKDGKNTYFSPLNLQSIPKPKSIKCYGRKATEEEIEQNKDTLGWIFSPDNPEWSPGLVVEGMNQYLNVRSAFQPEHPEEGDYVVSIDMCLEAGSPVQTKRGYLGISELKVGDFVLSPNGWIKVIRVEQTGVKKLIKVTTNGGGQAVYCSEEHPFIINGEKVEAKYITESVPLIPFYSYNRNIDSRNEVIKSLSPLLAIDTPRNKANYILENNLKDVIVEGLNKYTRANVSRWCGVNLSSFGHVLEYLNLPNTGKSYRCKFDSYVNNPFIECTPTSSYLLGFIYGDGNISEKRSGYLTLNISSKDFYHIRRIGEIFGQDVNIRYNTKGGKEWFTLDIHNTELCRTLMSLGVKKRKSYSGCDLPISWLGDNLRHFIRGLLDSDGSVRHSTHSYLEFSLVGHDSYIRKLYEISPDIWRYKSEKAFSILYLSGTKDDKRFIYNYLYEGATIWLQRKRDIIDKWYRDNFGDIVMPVWDITVDSEDHLYYVNGILTHNCGEELRIVTNLFKEHNWARVINSGGDLHHANSDAIFGPENYTKETRKRSKSAAFGMLYGQEAKGFQRKFPDMTLEEAREFMTKFKRAIPSIVRGQDRMLKEAKKTGTFYSGFGRPRRVKHYLTSSDYRDIAFGERTVKNGPIQSTAADVLKLEFIRLWDNIFTVYPDIKFICTIHDEINFSVPRRLANEVIPKMIRCMTVKMPGWVVTLDCSLSAGPTLGEQYPFKYNFETKEFTPDWEEDRRKDPNKEEVKIDEDDIEVEESIEDIHEKEEPIEEIDSEMFKF